MKSYVKNQKQQSLIHGFSQFKGDFFSRLWFTYRKEFPVLAGSTLTTDCGWGCMLRSGQMMLAQGFIMHLLGRHWNWYNQQSSEFLELHRTIIRWFGDIPSNQSPFSIHQLVSLGENSGIKAGEWYGPASVAHIFKRAIDNAHTHDPITQEVCVYVSQDCTVYKDDLIKLCSSHPTKKWQSVIIFVPVRLGGEKLNPIYSPCVRALLAHESCIGIIGGRPRHSLYFVGWQEDSLIYLDPHYCQPVVDVLPDDFPVESFHCMSPRKLPINKMDPSCTIGFYCKTQNDLMFFLSTIKDVLVPPKQKADYPIFIVCDGSVDDARKFDDEASENPNPVADKLLKFRHTYFNKDDETEHVVDSEEFVVL
ncbi:Cysteine protease ATG4D [Nymphon striatum]|nr:Cysteine protease ATG4D [Nymphon striatum]